MHYTGQDMLWMIGSLSKVLRTPFDPQLIRQQFPPPYTRTALLNALQSLGFKVGEMELDDESIATLERIPTPVVAFLREDEAETDASDNNSQQQQAGNRSGSNLQFAYRALIDLKEQFLEEKGVRHNLTPGMQVTAEIHLGTRSILEYLLSPVTGAFHEAARER